MVTTVQQDIENSILISQNLSPVQSEKGDGLREQYSSFIDSGGAQTESMTSS